MNPALNAPYLPLPQLCEEDEAPAPEFDPIIALEEQISSLIADLVNKDTKIAALEATILRQEQEIARLKLNALNWPPAMPKCIPGPADFPDLGHSIFRLATTEPHPPAAPVQSIMTQAQCQQIREQNAKPSLFSQLLRSNHDDDN